MAAGRKKVFVTTKAALGRALGVSRPTVSRAIKVGELPEMPAGGWNVEELKARWAMAVASRADTRGGNHRWSKPESAEKPTKAESVSLEGLEGDERSLPVVAINRLIKLEELRIKRVKATSDEAEARARSGQLIEREVVFRRVHEIFGAVRDRFLRLPHELAPRMLDLRTEGSAFEILDDTMRLALGELADDLDRQGKDAVRESRRMQKKQVSLETEVNDDL